MYELAVAYRIYPKVSKPAQGLPFDADKLRQAELCLRSFKRCLGHLKVKIWAIMDSCPIEYQDLFRRYFAPEDLVLVPLEMAGNHGTFSKQIDILLSQRDAEMIYFAEDDYLYRPVDFSRLMAFMKHGNNVHFVSPFDHPDDYNLEFHDFPKWVQVYDGLHWRNAASTCLTFLTTQTSLLRYQRIFRSYERRNYDTSLWISLTKYRVFNVVSMLRYASADHLFGRILVKAWLHSAWQNVFGLRARLWVPMPSFALHLDHLHIAPGFDLMRLMLEEDAVADGSLALPAAIPVPAQV